MKLPVDNGKKLVSQEKKITGCATLYFLSCTDLLLMCLDRKRTSAELETCCCLLEHYVHSNSMNLLDSNLPLLTGTGPWNYMEDGGQQKYKLEKNTLFISAL